MTVTVVSGLPRSGTSMLMQMLSAGGMPILTDEIRGADPDNPNGYLEFEPVKKLKDSADWLAGAEGRAVKIVHVHLAHLPPGHDYRVILIRRDMAEVLASQRIMLDRQGKSGAALDDTALGKIFAGQLAKAEAWLAAQPNIEVCALGHGDVLADPAAAAAKIAAFAGETLEVAAMAGIVDPALYRQRA